MQTVLNPYFRWILANGITYCKPIRQNDAQKKRSKNTPLRTLLYNQDLVGTKGPVTTSILSAFQAAIPFIRTLKSLIGTLLRLGTLSIR